MKQAPIKPEIAIDNLEKLDIRVGTIETVTNVPNSKKLMNSRAHTMSIVMLSLTLAIPVIAEEPEAADPWAPVRVLFGEWQGSGSGFGGESQVRHTYGFVLQDNFIRSTTVSTFQYHEYGTRNRRVGERAPR